MITATSDTAKLEHDAFNVRRRVFRPKTSVPNGCIQLGAMSASLSLKEALQICANNEAIAQPRIQA
jgi:hypothetical protein